MPGTPTAGTVDGTPNWVNLSVGWIDYTGNVRSDSYQLPAAVTNAQIQALVADLAAISNASLWKVEVTYSYNGDADKSNALEEVWEDVKTNLVFLAKNATNQRANIFVPSPEATVFIDTTELIDPANVDIAALLTSWLAALGAGYTVRGARLSKRSERGTMQAF